YRAKAVLRKRARALRGSVPREAIAERSARIVTELAHHAHLLAAREVALFYPMESKNEVDLRPLDAILRERATRIAYPWIDPETRVMTFRFVDDLATLEERGLGFREPPREAPEA